MRAVVQRVTNASVTVENETVGAIGPGVMVLIGVADTDTDKDLKYIVDKVMNLRIFDDENGVMNRSVADVGGSILAVSQFTLYGDARGGRRPSYFRAAKPEPADAMYAAKRPSCGNRPVPDGDDGLPRERRSGHHPAGQRKGVLNRTPFLNAPHGISWSARSASACEARPPSDPRLLRAGRFGPIRTQTGSLR